MIEMMVSLVIIAIVTTAALSFFINGLRSETGQRQRQNAVYLADQQMQVVQAIPVGQLVQGRTSAFQASALTQSIAGTLNLPAQSDASASASYDSNTNDTTPLIPLSLTQTVNKVPYTLYTFIYACHFLASTGNCGKTAATGSTTELRVTVAATWTSNAGCSQLCNYSTSTLVDPNSDSTFNTNISTPSGSVTTPSTSSFYNDNTATRNGTPAESCTTGAPGNTVTVPGTKIVITGTGFKSNIRVWISSGGGSIPTNTIYQPSATEVDACLQTGDVPGTYTLSVINSDGGHFQPTITEVPIIRWAALTGSGSNQTLTLNGGGFVSGATFSATSGSGVSGTFAVTSPTVATLTSYVGPVAGTTTAPVLTLTNPAPGSTQATFTLPDMSATINPTSVAVSTYVAVTVTGTGFQNGLATTSVTNGTATASYASATSAVVTLRATAVGTMSFALLNPDGGVSNTLTVTVDPLPTISPAPTPKLTSSTFTITGTGFRPGITGSVSGGDTATVTYVSSTAVTVVITGTGYGTQTLALANTDGGVVTTPIVVNPLPAVTSASTAVSGEVTTTLTGSGFQSNITASVTNGTVNSVTYVSSTQIKLMITGNTGNQTVTLTNPTDGGSTTATVLVDAPLDITAAETPVGAASAATITGTGFVNGMTVSSTRGGATVTWLSSTSANVYLPNTGSQVITLTNPDGGSDTATIVVNAAPNITGVALSPGSPTRNSTVGVTVTGTRFVSGATFTATWTRAGTATTNPTPTSVVFVNSTRETFNLLVPPTPSGGTKYTLTVTITNPDGGQDSQALTGVTVN
jgi:hypothetical protein